MPTEPRPAAPEYTTPPGLSQTASGMMMFLPLRVLINLSAFVGCPSISRHWKLPFKEGGVCRTVTVHSAKLHGDACCVTHVAEEVVMEPHIHLVKSKRHDRVPRTIREWAGPLRLIHTVPGPVGDPRNMWLLQCNRHQFCGGCRNGRHRPAENHYCELFRSRSPRALPVRYRYSTHPYR